MGKGRRKREKHATKHPAHKDLRLKASRLESYVRVLAVITAVLTLLGIAFQAWLQSIMYTNLHSGVYEAKKNTAEDIAALTHVLPTGTIALVLVGLGVLLTVVLLCGRKAIWSLLGCALVAAGIAFFIPYAYNLSLLFTYDALSGINNGEGLSLSVLIWQHYSALFPLVLLIPCEAMAFQARHHAYVADVMEGAQHTASTLTLDDEGPEE